MNTYQDNDYSKVEEHVKEYRELMITRHFSQRMMERAITYRDVRLSLMNPQIIRHEGSYDHYGNLRIKYTLQTKDKDGEDLAIVFAVGPRGTIILITVMYFWEEIGWERQADGLFLKS